MPPDERAWAFSLYMTGTGFDIEHIADDEPENPEPYWHVQQLIVAELDGTVAYGLRPGMGLELQVPLRWVRDRVHYLDLARQPYEPPNPGLHHRDETLTGIADPQLTMHLGHQGKSWSVGGRFGFTIPLSKTEPNPFELGRQGLWHQHIQFGTGTWDPVLIVAARRAIGRWDAELSGAARISLYENDHGYQGGDRYAGRAVATHPMGQRWSGEAGLLLAHETAETWDGHVETEGNLGRTDLFVSLGAACSVGPKSAIAINLQVPVHSHTTGHQVDIPAILSFGWYF
jgi:hypothetical protein